jgi:hypothetical protein
MIDLEQQLRHALLTDAAEAPPPHVTPPLARTRRRQATVVGGSILACLVVVSAVVGGMRFLPAPSPQRPAAAPAIPDGPLADVRTRTPEGTIRLTATGSAGELCLTVSGRGLHAAPACWTAGDLSGIAFEPTYATLGTTGHAIIFGVTSDRAVGVAFRYAGGGVTRARTIALAGVRPATRAFLLVSQKPIVRAELLATDANGETVGEPYWSVWGAAPSDGISCTCQDWLERQNGNA